jgi:hypothetical protein
VVCTRRRAGVRLYTSWIHFAKPCVFVKQSLLPIFLVPLTLNAIMLQVKRPSFLQSHARNLPSSFPMVVSRPECISPVHLCRFEYGLLVKISKWHLSINLLKISRPFFFRLECNYANERQLKKTLVMTTSVKENFSYFSWTSFSWTSFSWTSFNVS